MSGISPSAMRPLRPPEIPLPRFSPLDEAGSTVMDMISKMNKVNDIATNVAAISEEQSASVEEVSTTVDVAADSAKDIAVNHFLVVDFEKRFVIIVTM